MIIIERFSPSLNKPIHCFVCNAHGYFFFERYMLCVPIDILINSRGQLRKAQTEEPYNIVEKKIHLNCAKKLILVLLPNIILYYNTLSRGNCCLLSENIKRRQVYGGRVCFTVFPPKMYVK